MNSQGTKEDVQNVETIHDKLCPVRLVGELNVIQSEFHKAAVGPFRQLDCVDTLCTSLKPIGKSSNQTRQHVHLGHGVYSLFQ